MSQTGTRDPLRVELALLAISLASGLGALRLTTSPTQARLVLSVAATVVGGHLAVYLVQRLELRHHRRLPAVSLAGGVVFVALVCSWISVPSATFYGIPTLRTIGALSRLFDEAGGVIRSHPTPLSPTSGVVVCLIAGAGLASVLSRALFGSRTWRTNRSGSVLVSLVPTFGLFAYTAVLSSGVDRVTGAIAYIGAACVFLVVADLAPHPSRTSATRPLAAPRLVAMRRAAGFEAVRRLRTGVGTGLATVATAAVLALALSPSLAGMRLDALPFKGPAAASGGAGTAGEGKGGAGATSGSGAQSAIGALDLVANLQGVLTSRSQQVMFEARSPIPTYWQLGTLTVFNGSEWNPDPATARTSAQVPSGAPSTSDVPPLPVLPQPAVSSTFSAQVSLVGLGGRLLPVPPDTVAVSGPAATLNPAIGALYGENQAKQASAGLTYVATARTPSDSAAVDGNGSTSPSVTSAELAPYLALPSSVPPVVVSLAQQITAGAVGATAKAEALAQWFDSGLFRYTLDPPPPVPGEDPLVSFLLVSRAGFCQQFAGAYAVLARSIGLPTRLAVGFATGVPVGNANKKSGSAFGTTYRVTGADAHVWPEVYLGAQSGWISFEPTPPSANEPSPLGVVEGSTPPASIGAAPSASTTQPGSARTASGRTGRGAPARKTNLWVYLALGIACAGSLAVLAGVMVLLKRLWSIAGLRPLRFRRLVRDAGANEQVLLGLERASRGLRRAGLGRRDAETLDEHVTRLREREATGDLLPALGPYRELARLAERASYAADPCTEADASEAARLCGSVTSSLRPRRSPVGKQGK